MTTMIEVKVAELSGAALRYAVAIACGFKVQRIEEGDYNPGEAHWWMAYDERRVTPTRNGLVGYIKPGAKSATSGYDYCPDADWSQGGQLIDRYQVSFVGEDLEHTVFFANAFFDGKSFDSCANAHGPTRLIASMRAIVRLLLGDTVSVPAELVGGV